MRSASCSSLKRSGHSARWRSNVDFLVPRERLLGLRFRQRLRCWQEHGIPFGLCSRLAAGCWGTRLTSHFLPRRSEVAKKALKLRVLSDFAVQIGILRSGSFLSDKLLGCTDYGRFGQIFVNKIDCHGQQQPDADDLLAGQSPNEDNVVAHELLKEAEPGITRQPYF